MPRKVSPVHVSFWQCPRCLKVYDSKMEAAHCEASHGAGHQCASCHGKHDGTKRRGRGKVKMPCGAFVERG